MAKRPLKTKAAASPAAQNRQEAEQLVGRIGEIQREMIRREADMGDVIARVKAGYETGVLPLRQELDRAQAAVQAWSEANRTELTRDNRTKTIELATGKVFWRLRPPKVTLRGVDAIIEHLKGKRSLRGFLRVKYEVDKEAMAAKAAAAAKVPGVTIASAGEDFIIEPFEAELVEGAS